MILDAYTSASSVAGPDAAQASACSTRAPVASSRASPPAGATSCSPAGRGPDVGTGRHSAGNPARLSGLVSSVYVIRAAPSSGGAKNFTEGRASSWKRARSAPSSSWKFDWDRRAASACSWVMAAALSRRSVTK